MSSSGLDQLVDRPSRWLSEAGPNADLVLSTRVRLARNLRDFPFTQRAAEEEMGIVVSRVVSACQSSPSLAGGDFLAMGELTELDRQFLAERHLISREMVSEVRPAGLFLATGEGATVMVNEEDHLRLTTVVAGFEIDRAWEAVRRVEEELDSALEFAYSEELGYLTACPTNVGTGMRVSVFVHLPSLVLTKRIRQVLRGISQVGLAVRGFYGEGSEILGNFFQISNQTTLGLSERETIENLEKVTRQVLEAEVRARRVLLKEAHLQIEDKVFRAYGTLSHARVIAAHEVINLVSAVRFGVALGIGPQADLTTLNQLLVLTQPAHLQKLGKREMTEAERNVFRATLVRERLAEAHPTPGTAS
jgi:protein arginine kinase